MNAWHHPGYYVALGALPLALVVIALGAFTRLADAGLGCPDWPGCYGHLLWPETPEELATAQVQWPDSTVDWRLIWPEVVHRIAAAILGLVVLVLAAIAWRMRGRSNYPVGGAWLLLLLVIAQGLFGMWTVTLKLWPQVVSLHLLGGHVLLALLCLHCLRLRVSPPPPVVAGGKQFFSATAVALVLVLIQIALGGWLTSNYAAVACPDLPGCQGHWLPPADFATGFNLTQQIGPNYLGGQLDNEARVAIHLTHRLGAILLLIYGTVLGVMLLRSSRATVFGSAKALLLLLWLQFLLGLANVWFHFPLAIAVAHNLGAALLLSLLVTLLWRLGVLRWGEP